jgi:hypothetical protein
MYIEGERCVGVSEFLAIWRGLEEINRRALEEARQAALKVCEVIRERYWGRVEEVSKKYGLRPMLGVGVEGGCSIGYRPVLYLFSDKPRDGDLAGIVYEELGGWVGGARLSIVIITEEGGGLERCPYCGTQLLLGAKVTQGSKPAEAKSAVPESGQLTIVESSQIIPEASPETVPPAQLQPSKPRPEPESQHLVTVQPSAMPIQPQVTESVTARPQAAEDYVPYDALLRGEFEENTVYLLPIKRSALPTALIAEQAKVVFNLEGSSRPPVVGAIAQTRTNYRSNYKGLIKPSPSHPYVRRVIREVSEGYGTVWIITEEMYGMEEVKAELDRRGFRAKSVLLDVEGARRKLERAIMSWLSRRRFEGDIRGHAARLAAKLAKAGALIPWLADELEANGWEGVKRRLIQLLGERDGKEVHLTLIEALKEIPFYPNKPLAVSLGIYEVYSRRKKEGSKNGKRYIDLGGID